MFWLPLICLLISTTSSNPSLDSRNEDGKYTVNLQNRGYKEFPADISTLCYGIDSLDLSHNEIEVLRKEDFQNCQNLNVLNINNNKLKTLNADVFNWLSLETIALHENPFECDCSLLWLADYFKTVKVVQNVYCSHVKSSKTYNINDLPGILDECLLKSNSHSVSNLPSRQRRAVDNVVKYTPVEIDGCPFKLLVGTILTFNITSDTQQNVTLMLDGVPVFEGTSVNLFSYTFDTAGTFNAQINLSSTITSEWQETIEVVNVTDMVISFWRQIGHTWNIPTNINTTFTLKSDMVDLSCVVMNTFNWTVNDVHIIGNIHRFDSVGKQVTPVLLSLSNTNIQVESIYLQLYDEVTDFTVTVLSYDTCRQGIMKLFVVANGTGVQYSYKVLGENILNGLPFDREHEIKIPVRQNFSIIFRAANIVSSLEVTKNFSHTDDMNIVLSTQQYVYVEELAIIQPEIFDVCDNYTYQWLVNTISLKTGNSPEVPTVNHTFRIEGTYRVMLKLTIENKDPVTYERQVLVVGRIDFDLPLTGNAHVDKSFLLSPVINSPDIYRYRWYINDSLSTTWQDGVQSSPPVFNVTFTTENWYSITLEFTNGVTTTNKSVDVKAQYPVVDLTVENDVLFVELGKTYQVLISYRYASRFAYSIHVYDERATVHETPHTHSSFYRWSHRATYPDNIIIFKVSDNLNTVSLNVSVVAMNRITFVNATLSKNVVKVGDPVEGYLIDAPENIEPVNYTWYCQPLSLELPKLIGTSANLSYIFNMTGEYVILLVARNEISNGTATMKILVDFLLIQFVANVPSGENITAPGQSALIPGVSVNFVAYPTSTYSHAITPPIFEYKWYINDIIQTKITSNTFSYNTSLQGQFNLKVHISTGFVGNSSTFVVYVQKALTHVSLDSDYSNHSFINKNMTHLQYRFVYREPTDAVGVFGTVICLSSGQHIYAANYPQLVYNVPLNSSGVLLCNVSLSNRVSSVSSSYQYLVGEIPNLMFEDPLKTASTGSPYKFRIDITHIDVTSTIVWTLNTSTVLGCSNEINTAGAIECQIQFQSRGKSIVNFYLINSYLQLNKSIEINVYDPVTNVDIFPKWIHVGISTNVTVSGQGDGNMEYWWKDFDSQNSYITVLFDKTGTYNITVNMSNPVSVVSKEFSLNVYRTGQFWIGASRRIVNNDTHRTTYMPVNTTQRFYVRNADELSTYDWQVTPTKPKTSFNMFFPKKLEQSYYFTHRYTSYQIACTENSHAGDDLTKYLYVLIYDPVFKLSHSFGDEPLVAGQAYSLAITWVGTGPQWVDKFQMVGVQSFTKVVSLEKQLITVDFTTSLQFKNFTLDVHICGRVNCMRKRWRFNMKVNAEDVTLKIGGSEVEIRANTTNVISISVNSTVTISLPSGIELSDATIYFRNENGTDHEKDQIELLDGKLIFTLKLPPGTYTLILEIGGEYYSYLIEIFMANCEEPSVRFLPFREHVKSQWFYSELNITSNCSDVKYDWSFDKLVVDSCKIQALNTEPYYPQHLKGMTLVRNKPVLEIPPRGFEVGIYCVHHSLQYGGKGKKTSTFELDVRGTPLVPVLIGGSYRVIGNKQQITLDASNTMDPDIENGNKSDILYRWKTSNDSYHCFYNNHTAKNLSTWSSDNVNISLKTNCLEPLTSHIITVEVRRKDEEDIQQTAQLLDVVNGVAPLIKIHCFTCNAYKSYKYLRGKKLKLLASCINCGAQQEIEYKWQILGSNDNKVLELTSSNLLSPPLSAALVLEKYTLDGKQTYSFLCEAKVTGMDAPGSTVVDFPVNFSPENGTCTMTPLTGISMVDLFTMTCTDWKDADNENQPFVYWLLAGETPDSSNMSILYRGIKSSLSLYLPLGEKNNNVLYFEIWVQDSLGAYTIANASHIIVTPSAQAQTNPVQFVVDSVLPFLKSSTESKDLNQILTGIVASLSFIENDQANVNQNKSIVLNTLVNSANGVDTSSVESLTQLVDAMNKIYKTSNETDISKNSHDSTSSSLNDMIVVADAFSNSGINLDDVTYNGFANVISKNLMFYSDEDVTERKRRAIENNTDALGNSFNLMQRLYEVILKTTVTGEQDRTISTDLISTLLSRNTGKKIMTSKTVGSCYSSSNVTVLSQSNDVNSVFECSTLDPYLNSYDRNIASLSYFSYDFKEISVRDLPENEHVMISIPNTLTTEPVNSTFKLSPNLLYGTVLSNFSSIDDIPYVGFHLVLDIGDAEMKNGVIDVYVSEDLKLTFENAVIPNFTIRHDTTEEDRTLFLSGSLYNISSSYYYGIRHNFPTPINITLTTYISRCVFWNKTLLQWESSGCEPTGNTTRQTVFCKCNHLTSFSSSLNLKPNPLDFSVLTELDISDNPVALATAVAIAVLYLLLAFFAWRKDKKENGEKMRIPFIGSKDGFYQYEIRIKTGMYPWSGTSAKVGIQLFGTGCTTKVRVIKTENSFQRNAVDIFRISLDRSIGKIHKVRIWHDNSGSDPSWYLERVVIRSLVNGEKFFFFCNRWIGTDCEDGMLEHDFHVADIHEMQKFSTIFYDVIGRGFNDYHLWLSIFERPKFSRFTRLQRITCLFTFILSWMCINAMWFDIAPEGKVDLYIGFQAYSFEEIFIGLITALIVLPLNLFLIFLFRKSKQRYAPEKKVKIWKATRHIKQDTIDVDMVQLLEDREESTDDFSLDSNCSPIRRKRKYLNIHELMEQENAQEFIDVAIPSSSTDRLVLRTAELTNPQQDSIPPLTLPHSFASNSLLTLSPQHQYRVNSEKLPRRNSTGHDNLVQLTMDRTHSLESLGIPSADEQSRYMKPRIDPEELRSHMTDIVEQQLSSILNGLQNEKKHEMPLPSEYSSSIFHHEAITASLIKKNEMLAEQLQIPVIKEFDPCTHWYLPFWCKYIAFFLCFIISGLSIVIILIYGQQFGYDLSLKWLRVLFIQCIEDFFLAYPILLLVVGFVLAVIIKPLDLDQIDHLDFYECGDGHVIQCDKTSTNDPILPPSGYALELLQREGLKRKRLRKFVKEIIYQGLLMWFVIGICSSKYSQYIYPETKMVEQQLTAPFPNFTITRINDYWSWLETAYIPHVLSTTTKQSRINWKLASPPIIRQIRTTDGDCPSQKYAQLSGIKTCDQNSFISVMKFDQNWSIPLSESVGNEDYSDVWAYRSHGSLKTYGTVHSIIPASGYEWHIPQRIEKVTTQLQYLKKQNWVDKYTRGLMHHYVLLNTNYLQFADINILFEFSSTGYIHQTFDIRYFYPNYFLNNLDYFSVTCLVLLAIITIFMAIYLLRLVHRKNVSELLKFWTLHYTVMFLVSTLCILLQFGQFFLLSDFRDDLENGNIPYGLDVHDMALLDDVIMYLFGFLAFLVIIRNIRLFSNTSIYEYSSELLVNAFKPMFNFIVLHLLVVFGFSALMMLIFQQHVFSYRNLWQSFLSTLFHQWCRNDVSSTVNALRYWGICLSIIWMLYILIIARNMMRAIILNSNNHNGGGVVNKSNEEGLLKYIWKRIRRNNKKIRHVHFNNPHNPQYQIISGEECSEKDDDRIIETFNDLPPLPYPAFDLDSTLMTILASLDQMLVDEDWECEMLGQLNRKICLEKSKAFYSIEKLPGSSKC